MYRVVTVYRQGFIEVRSKLLSVLHHRTRFSVLKRIMSRDFVHASNRSGPLTNRRHSPRCASQCGDNFLGVQLCITPLSQSPQCASHRGVICSKFLRSQELIVSKRSMHHSAETISAVWIPPRRLSLWWASHHGVNLHSVHHTTETISAVGISPRRQSAHRGVKIEIFSWLWLLLKGQSWAILLGVNTEQWTHIHYSYHDEKIWIIKCWFTKNFFWDSPVCTLRNQLCDRISRRNQKIIRKHFSLFIRDPDGFESWILVGTETVGSIGSVILELWSGLKLLVLWDL